MHFEVPRAERLLISYNDVSKVFAIAQNLGIAQVTTLKGTGRSGYSVYDEVNSILKEL